MSSLLLFRHFPARAIRPARFVEILLVALALGTLDLCRAQDAQKASQSQTKGAIRISIVEQVPGQVVERKLTGIPLPKQLWKGEPLVHPRGVKLDPDGDALWISDPGEPEEDPKNKPARIIRFPLRNGIAGTPTVFFQRPGFLYSAKWAVPVKYDGKKQLLVADQGQPTSEFTFTGKGAKVFFLPIRDDGRAGEPKVLWEGPPFFAPTGVALVGKFIYVTDACAGPERTRPERPDHPFPSSSIYALSPAGGQRPILLKSDPRFTSLISINSDIPGELLVDDTDSGRLDPRLSPGRQGFAPQASSDLWRLRILDPDKPTLSDPERTTFMEEIPVSLRIEGVKADAEIAITVGTTAKVRNEAGIGAESIIVKAGSLARGNGLTVSTLSDVLSDTIPLRVRVTGQAPIELVVQKDKDRPITNKDRKNSQFRARPSSEVDQAGRRGNSFDWVTFDNARGSGAVLIFPDGGGPLIPIAQGPPLDRPLGGQFSPDGKTLWFTDQGTGSFYSLPFPSGETFDLLFGSRKGR